MGSTVSVEPDHIPGIFNIETDLQIPKFVSFRPHLESIAANAFNVDWGIRMFMQFHHSFMQHVCYKNYGRTKYLAEWLCQTDLTKSGTPDM